MPTFDDAFSGSGSNSKSASSMVAIVSKASSKSASPAVTSPMSATNIDTQWGGAVASLDPPLISPYYEYYYSGQDIIVAIDGATSTSATMLPIMELGWNVVQSKLAMYGFWSYTYDAIARGSRSVSGSFVIATTSPNYMKNTLIQVAQARNNKSTAYTNTSVSEDDKNILNFWGTGATSGVTLESGSNLKVFQQHPPFDFIIIHGVQDVSVNQSNNPANIASMNNLLYTDINERLVDPSALTNQQNRIVLTSCEILGMSTQYTVGSSGQQMIVSETYSFLANDVQYPS